MSNDHKPLSEPATNDTDGAAATAAASNEPSPGASASASFSSSSSSSSCASSSDLLSRGISTLLASVLRDFDSRAEDAISSQDHLSSSIDRLTRELDQLLEDAPVPFIMQHAAKITGVRKRVSSLNLLLKSIQQRIDNIDRMLCIGSHCEKASTETSGV